MRRNARTDGTQTEIVDALRSLGATIVPLHTVGRGCPDLAVSTGKPPRWFLVEIKNGTRPRWYLTEAQKIFQIKHAAPVVILDSVESAIVWLNRLNRSKS